MADGILTTSQWEILAVAVFVCVPQGLILFRDAQKRGRFPWLWGLWGLLSFPLPSVFYLIFVVFRGKKKPGARRRP